MRLRLRIKLSFIFLFIYILFIFLFYINLRKLKIRSNTMYCNNIIYLIKYIDLNYINNIFMNQLSVIIFNMNKLQLIIYLI